MEETNNLINILLSNGGTVTMAVLFIVFLYLDRKDRKDKEAQDEVKRKEEQEEKKAEREASVFTISAGGWIVLENPDVGNTVFANVSFIAEN